MKLKRKQIVNYKGEIGEVLKYDNEEIYRFASLKNKPSWMKKKEEFPIINPKIVKLANKKEMVKWLFSETEWLGKTVKLHKIGEYQIVEYKSRNNDGTLEKQSSFTTYINYESCGYSYESLDRAIVGSIAYKHEGHHTYADRYFMRMIKKED